MKTASEILKRAIKRKVGTRARAEVVAIPKKAAKEKLDPEGWRRSRIKVMTAISQEMLKRMGAKLVQKPGMAPYYGPVRYQRWEKWAGVWGLKERDGRTAEGKERMVQEFGERVLGWVIPEKIGRGEYERVKKGD